MPSIYAEMGRGFLRMGKFPLFAFSRLSTRDGSKAQGLGSYRIMNKVNMAPFEARLNLLRIEIIQVCNLIRKNLCLFEEVGETSGGNGPSGISGQISERNFLALFPL